ncbi:MAG: hypothetical protein LAO20_08940 [Acidobacteriia bacterium]|nr:hypothetical protein [Terriglobia bacterium]
MPIQQVSLSQFANAQLGISYPLAYGYHDVRGNEILNFQLTNKNHVIIRLLGDGEWDGIDRLFINSKLANHLDTNLVHFHPGQEGILGHGLAIESNGGDQKVDNFWSLLGSNYQPLAYSRIAYLMLNIPPDPGAPSPTVDVLGHYRGVKVRIFDSSGNQTGYQFSTNGAWQCLDAILRSMLNADWLPSSAAAGDLSAAQKARIDFPSLVDAASVCDGVLSNGNKRFESSVAFAQQVSLQDALTQLCLVSQLYVTEKRGKIYIRADKARSSTFLLTSDHVVAGTASFDKVDIHGAKNRVIANYRDLNASSIATIDTPGNSGLSRSGVGVVTVKTTQPHGLIVNDNVQVCAPLDGSTHDTGFDGVFPVASVPDTTHLTYAQLPPFGTNLLTNGDGEAGTVGNQETSWTLDAGNGLITANDFVEQGSKSMKITNPAAVTSFNGQNVNLVAGQIYVLSCWIKTDAFAVNAVQGAFLNIAIVSGITSFTILTKFGAYDAGNPTLPIVGLPADNTARPFTLLQCYFTCAANGVVRVRCQLSTNNGSAVSGWFDDVQVYASSTGVTSGNGYIGTAESRFAQRAEQVDHEAHQQAIGQRGLSLAPQFRVVPVTIDLCANLTERVLRILKVLKNRALGQDTTPYIAPWKCKITAFLDAVDAGTRALAAQIPGDIITVDATISEEHQGDYELLKATYIIPPPDANSGGNQGSSGVPSDAAVIELELLAYNAAAFSDNTFATLPLIVPPARTGVSPILTGKITGATPTTSPIMSQSGTTLTINFAASTWRLGDGDISENSGSATASGFSVVQYGYIDDPAMLGGAGGSVHLSTNVQDMTAFWARLYCGKITPLAGGGGSGSGGGSGNCVPDGVMIRLADGQDLAIEDCYDVWLTESNIRWRTPWGSSKVESIEIIEDEPLFDLEFEPCEALARYGNKLPCAGRHTIKVWGLWEAVGDIYMPSGLHLVGYEQQHHHDVRGVRVWVCGGVASLTARTPREARARVFKVKLKEHHVYMTNGVWAHNILNK